MQPLGDSPFLQISKFRYVLRDQPMTGSYKQPNPDANYPSKQIPSEPVVDKGALQGAAKASASAN